jgi:hypothetical protein
MNKITVLGITIIFLYCIIQILQFYGVSPSSYLVYVYFLIFILITFFVLPTEYPKV